MFILTCEEDLDTACAAAGALAMLTSISAQSCAFVLEKNWLDNFKQTLAHPDPSVQHRAVVTALNIINASRELAEKLLETELLEILMALTLLEEKEREQVKGVALQALAKGEAYGIIQRPGESEREGRELDKEE